MIDLQYALLASGFYTLKACKFQLSFNNHIYNIILQKLSFFIIVLLFQILH